MTRDVQRLVCLFESNDVELQTMPVLLKEATRIREELSTAEGSKNRLTAEINVELALETEISERKMTTGSFFCFFQSLTLVLSRPRRTWKWRRTFLPHLNLNRRRYQIRSRRWQRSCLCSVMSDPKLKANLYELTALEELMKHDVRRLLSKVSTESQNLRGSGLDCEAKNSSGLCQLVEEDEHSLSGWDCLLIDKCQRRVVTLKLECAEFSDKELCPFQK